MKVTLLKNWGKHHEGDEVDVKDLAVVAKGKKTGLFVDESASADAKQDSKTKKGKK